MTQKQEKDRKYDLIEYFQQFTVNNPTFTIHKEINKLILQEEIYRLVFNSIILYLSVFV